MKVLLKRIAKKEKYTIGKLYIDGQYVCDTIEDKDRGLTLTMPLSEIKAKKVYGETAIPTGTYELTLKVQSPKYSKKPTWYAYNKGYMPRILNVPGFDGILMHTGNTLEDSYGCVVLGENKVVGKVINSMTTFKKVYPILKKATDKITITIE